MYLGYTLKDGLRRQAAKHIGLVRHPIIGDLMHQLVPPLNIENLSNSLDTMLRSYGSKLIWRYIQNSPIEAQEKFFVDAGTNQLQNYKTYPAYYISNAAAAKHRNSAEPVTEESAKEETCRMLNAAGVPQKQITATLKKIDVEMAKKLTARNSGITADPYN